MKAKMRVMVRRLEWGKGCGWGPEGAVVGEDDDEGATGEQKDGVEGKG